MPAIKRDQFANTDRYKELHKQTVATGEDNDCTVKMFALAARIPYAEALEIAAKYGRKPGKGMYPHQWKRMLKENGVKFCIRKPAHFINRYPKAHRVLKSVTTHHPDRFKSVWEDGKRYILHCSQHVAYVENGVNHDWTRGRAMRVHTIYEIEQPE